MRIEHCGLGLFILIYIFVWVKNYTRTRDALQDGVLSLKSGAWMPFLNLVSMGWEIMGAGLLILLILTILVMTCFRALSFLSMGIFVDPFSLHMAFGWTFSVRLLVALVAGSVLTSVVIIALIALGTTASQGTQRSSEGSTSKWTRRLMSLVVFTKTNASKSQAIQKTMVHLILMANLVIMSTTVLLTYSMSSVSTMSTMASSYIGPGRYTLAMHAAALAKRRMLLNQG